MTLKEDSIKSSSFLDKMVDFVFSKDERKWVILIMLLGLTLRIIVASNVPPVADEMVHGVHSIGFSKLAPLSGTAQAQVWYYLTDYLYRIFGIHLLTARLLSVIFGTLSILVVYLLGTMLFNKRIALVAAFLLAISPYHIDWTSSYQDMTMMFFVLLASYFFIKSYRDNGTLSIASAIFLGIAELVKIITGVFIVVFAAFGLWVIYQNYQTNKTLFKKNIQRMIVIIIILILSFVPVLAYNYFLYKEKGIVDLAFAQFLRINAEFYTGPGLAHGEGFVLQKLPHNLYSIITEYFIKEDPFLSVLMFAGLILMVSRWKERTFGDWFLIGMFFFVLLFIASAIVLQTHYTSFFPLMALFGAFFLVNSHTLVKKINYSYVLYGVIFILLIYNVYSLRGPLTSQSGVEKMRSFAINSIDNNALVLTDSRIYTGTTVWMFNDKNYVDVNVLPQLVQLSNSSGRVIPVKAYFIECVTDDCGWGTIKNQPEVNATMERWVAEFDKLARPSEVDGGGNIVGVRGEEVVGKPLFRVYQVTIPLNPGVFDLIKQTHNHFLYHIPRNEFVKDAFDYYTVDSGLDTVLNIIAYAILYVLLALAALSILMPFYLLLKKK